MNKIKRVVKYFREIFFVNTEPQGKLNFNIRNIIDFKTTRQSVEWNDEKLNLKVKNIAFLLAFYAYSFLEKRLVITDIYRTQQEQNHIYRNNKKYKQHAWASVHMFHRGVDIRTSNLTDKEIKTLVKIGNTIIYDSNRLNKQTVIYHKVGDSGKHIHIQVFPL